MRIKRIVLAGLALIIACPLFSYQIYIFYQYGGGMYAGLGILLFPLAPLVPLLFIPLYGYSPTSLPAVIFYGWLAALFLFALSKVEGRKLES